MLFYEDKTFTVATGTDQYIATSATNNNMSHEQYPINLPESQPIGKPLRYLSVCSGMEAASVAWHPLGWTPVGFSEIEPFPCAILKHRFPNVPNYGSLTEYQSWPLEPGSIDLLVGGCPCQSFSVAGLRRGMQDPRGNLTLTYLGLADKLKPKWIIYENVPGLLSSNGGRDFGAFLGALVQLGYGFAYRVLDAQHFRGTPQRRRRVFVVACRNPVTGLGDWRAAAEVLSITEGLHGYLEAGNKKRKSPAADAGASVAASGLPRTVGTLCADTHPGAYSGQDAYTGRLIPAPVSHWEGGDVHPTLNQAHNIGSPGYSNQELFSQKGAGLVPTPYRKSKRACSATDSESWVLADSSNTLNNFDLGDTRTTHAVVQPVAYILDSFTSNSMLSDNPNSGCREVDVTKCLDTSCLNPACHQGGVMITQPAIAIQGTIIGRSENAGPQGTGASEGGPMFTLTKTDIHGVSQNMAVRRLTPNECYRLQGFPDNWGRIPWKGKPAEECPDGPQYKAAGNSMAVPVMHWIGNRIAEYEAKA
jgi:DNA (cytosine-5)-methyltransferase 1